MGARRDARPPRSHATRGHERRPKNNRCGTRLSATGSPTGQNMSAVPIKGASGTAGHPGRARRERRREERRRSARAGRLFRGLLQPLLARALLLPFLTRRECGQLIASSKWLATVFRPLAALAPLAQEPPVWGEVPLQLWGREVWTHTGPVEAPPWRWIVEPPRRMPAAPRRDPIAPGTSTARAQTGHVSSRRRHCRAYGNRALGRGTPLFQPRSRAPPQKR
jgi:hypothetical protein